VKKSVIALIIVVALVVLVSPGIVGMLADRAVEQQTAWVAEDTSEVEIRSERFDRGWFSSEGTHRVSLNESLLGDDERAMLEAVVDGPLPDLVIETRIDHGLVPLASLGREQGTLKPGLGSAVSRLALEFPDGERRELPGAIYSDIGLVGNTLSRYELEAGSYGDLRWGKTHLAIRADPQSGRVDFDGGSASLEILASGDGRSLQGLSFDGFVTPTRYGFSTGDFDVTIDRLMLPSPAGPVVPVGPISLTQTSSIVDGRLDSGFSMNVAVNAVPGIGDLLLAGDLAVDGADAASIGRLLRDLDALPGSVEPAEILDYAGESLEDLCAAGFRVVVERLDLELPNGVLATRMDIDVPATDRAAFTWPSLLLAAELDAHVSIPAPLYDMASLMSPEVAQAVEMGLLAREGDNYEMDAVYRKGLLTVNGAPLPIPLSGF